MKQKQRSYNGAIFGLDTLIQKISYQSAGLIFQIQELNNLYQYDGKYISAPKGPQLSIDD